MTQLTCWGALCPFGTANASWLSGISTDGNSDLTKELVIPAYTSPLKNTKEARRTRWSNKLCIFLFPSINYLHQNNNHSLLYMLQKWIHLRERESVCYCELKHLQKGMVEGSVDYKRRRTKLLVLWLLDRTRVSILFV